MEESQLNTPRVSEHLLCTGHCARFTVKRKIMCLFDLPQYHGALGNNWFSEWSL